MYRLDALKAALQAHEDIDTVRSIFDEGSVPQDIRIELWKDCLNVSRRPDTLGSWSGPLDTESQETIHTQCMEQAGGYSHNSQLSLFYYETFVN